MDIGITYVGKDQRYYETLKSDMTETYSAHNLSFYNHMLNDENNYVDVFERIIKDTQNILFLDFSTDLEDVTKLLNLFVAYKADGLCLVGLYPQVDNDKTRTQNMRVNLELGVDVNIIKSGSDFLEPMYLGFRVALPEILIKPTFYELKEKDGLEGKLIDIGKVNYISKEEIECETNLEVMVEDEVEIKNELPVDIVESDIFTCLDTENKNLYYKRNFKLKLHPIFLDYIFEKEDLNKLEKLKIADDKERREHLVETKNLVEYEQWIEQESGESIPELVKIALVDHNLFLLKEEDKIGTETLFSYRVWANSRKCERDLMLYHPDILVFQMELDEGREKPNDEKALERLIKFITLNEFKPYIVVFGAVDSTENMRQKYGYEKLITNPDNIFMNAIMGLIKAFDQRKNLVKEEEGSVRFVPTKEMSISNFFIAHKINILHISEYSMDFELDRELVYGSFFNMSFPCDLIVRIMPHLENSQFAKQQGVHHGIFHSITNDEKKKLRQFLQQKK